MFVARKEYPMLHLIFSCLLLTSTAMGGDLLKAVPAEADIVVSVRSLEELKETAGNGAWGRFIKDPEMTACIESWMNFMGVATGEEQEQDLSPFGLIETVSGGLAFFVDMEGEKNFGGGVLLAPGTERDAFDEYLGRFKDFMFEMEKTANSSDTYADEELLIFEPEESMYENPGVILCDTGEVVILCGHSSLDRCQEVVHAMIDRLHGEAAGECILDSTLFLDAREGAGGQGMVEVYADTGGLIATALDAMAVEDEEESENVWASLLGLDGIGTMFLKADFGEGEEFELILTQGLSGEGAIRGFADCFMAPMPRDQFALMPQNAVTAAASMVDLNGIYTRILDLIQAADENAYMTYRQVYETMIQQRFGIDPEKEILALLDGRICSFTVPVPREEVEAAGALMEGVDPQGYVYLIGVKDDAAFQANFEKILRAFGVYVSLKKEDFLGTQIYSIAMPGGSARLHWVYSPGLVAFSPFPTPVRALVRLLAHEEQPSVMDREDYVAIIESSSGASALSMAETANSLKTMIGAFQMMAPMLAPAGPFMTEEGFLNEESAGPPFGSVPPFPSPALVDKYFKGVSGSIVDVNETGILLRFFCR
jgi:hypothetical protein